MLYLWKHLLLLINIDETTVLNWFGIDNSQTFSPSTAQMLDFPEDLQPSRNVSLETFRLIIEGLWDKLQDGLTLADIENLLFFILFIRFVILAIRYNLKTSLYITCIGLFAGYLWYRHLIDLISLYRTVLIKIPFVNKLGMDAVQLASLNRQMVLTDLKLGENVHWYNPGQLVYYAFTKGIVHVDPETGLRSYIDPISMFISNLDKDAQANVVPLYYKVYNKIIPKIYDVCSKFWGQLSGIAAYAVITRIGKRYCPYLVRWHWTFLLIIAMIEQVFIYFIFRASYFQSFVLIPKAKASLASLTYVDESLSIQIGFVNALIAIIILCHIGLVLLGLFHAIWGQYFYFPFIVENTELHIGPRPKNSIYSGGNTSWQDEKEKNMQRLFPKLWFGWFGRGTDKKWKVIELLKRFVINSFKTLRKQFRR